MLGVRARPTQNCVWHAPCGAVLSRLMNGLVVNISWEYLLVFIGAVLGIAYYAHVRFARLEASIKSLTGAVQGLKISAEDSATRLFQRGATARLTQAGQRILKRSGLKSYIDAHKDELLARCDQDQHCDSYEFQACMFRVFAELTFDDTFAHDLNEFAFANGVSTDLLRRAGAAYLSEFSEVSL